MPSSSGSSNTTCRRSFRRRWRGSESASASEEAGAAAALLAAFERQRDWCREPSPFTSWLLDRSLQWLHRDGADALAVLAALDGDPTAAAVALRWAASLHLLALRGMVPWGLLWPPHRADDARLDAAIRLAWNEQRPALDAALALPPQTNEVQRSAALLPGLLHIAAATKLPLALREIGASAGLNLWPERHHYRYRDFTWGDSAAVLHLGADWRGAAPPPALTAATLRIAGRAACDAQPIDIGNPAAALRLTSYVWADQRQRLDRIATALRITPAWMAADGVGVDRQRAVDFVGARFAPAEGVTTVLVHSIVWQYIEAAEQAAITARVEAAGATATPAAPLAWLRLEPADPTAAPELRCRIWPGGRDVLLARAHPHGNWIDWAGAAA